MQTEDLTPSLARRLGLHASHGALVDRVTGGGPAARAGIHGGSHTLQFQGTSVVAGGDVVLAIGGTTVASADDLVRIVTNKLRPGTTVVFTVLRAGRTRSVGVRLVGRPSG